MDSPKLISAKTHPPEYKLHKYWARKPHNVISHLLSSFVPENGIIIDPFCGSGVTLREASKLGYQSYGFDINPVSILISEVLTTSSLDIDEFYFEVKRILDEVESLNPSYKVNSTKIKYLVHETVVQCFNCNTLVPLSNSIKQGRIYKCINCKNKIRFNLENLKETHITSIVLEGGKVIKDSETLKKQEALSNISGKNNKKYDQLFTENRRILAFDGLSTSKLFTPRNFSILSDVANRIHKIKNEEVRKAALVMLTASVAQCSRLIPYRNNMKTGGPAWSVPGFWGPPKHLETNPLNHLNARLTKFIRGLKDIKDKSNKGAVNVKKIDAVTGLKGLRDDNVYADLIFFDPPYGDSVPYTEFSNMWNSFLQDIPNVNTDISVSDRLPKSVAWNRYSEDLKSILSEINVSLKQNGKLLMTFNNHDLRAWEALFKALQENNFECQFVTYQIPAVISSKAQFSPEGSYNSDIYSIYTINSNLRPTRSLTPVVEALKKCASSRNGIIAKNLALRVTTIAWMQNNISADLLIERDELIEGLFEQKNKKLIWKGNIDNNIPKLRDIAKKKATQILSQGPCKWNYLYEEIASETVSIGIPDPGELRIVLDDIVIFNKNKCMAVQSNTEQLEIPEDLFQ